MGVSCNNGEDYELVYDTEITNDVIGYLSENGVDNLLTQIEALPSPSKDNISPSKDNISPSDEPWRGEITTLRVVIKDTPSDLTV